MPKVFFSVYLSSSTIDVLGNAFGVIVLNEFGTFASHFYCMFLETSQLQVLRQDDFSTLKTSLRISRICLTTVLIFCINLIIVQSLRIFVYKLEKENYPRVMSPLQNLN